METRPRTVSISHATSLIEDTGLVFRNYQSLWNWQASRQQCLVDLMIRGCKSHWIGPGIIVGTFENETEKSHWTNTNWFSLAKINKFHVYGRTGHKSNTMKYYGIQSGKGRRQGAAANNQDTVQNWKYCRVHFKLPGQTRAQQYPWTHDGRYM